jgi:hypothetical protein
VCGPLWYTVVTFDMIEHGARGHGGLQHRGVVGIHVSRGLASSNGVHLVVGRYDGVSSSLDTRVRRVKEFASPETLWVSELPTLLA